LENEEFVPLKALHASASLKQFPTEVKTVFPKKSKLKPKVQKRKVVLKRTITIALHFPSREVYDIFLSKLLEAKCYASPNKKDLTITVPDSARPEISKIVKALKKEYQISIKDL